MRECVSVSVSVVFRVDVYTYHDIPYNFHIDYCPGMALESGHDFLGLDGEKEYPATQHSHHGVIRVVLAEALKVPNAVAEFEEEFYFARRIGMADHPSIFGAAQYDVIFNRKMAYPVG